MHCWPSTLTIVHVLCAVSMPKCDLHRRPQAPGPHQAAGRTHLTQLSSGPGTCRWALLGCSALLRLCQCANVGEVCYAAAGALTLGSSSLHAASKSRYPSSPAKRLATLDLQAARRRLQVRTWRNMTDTVAEEECYHMPAAVAKACAARRGLVQQQPKLEFQSTKAPAAMGDQQAHKTRCSSQGTYVHVTQGLPAPTFVTGDGI